MILHQLQRQILRALVENRPETSDMEALTNHCGALASGIVRLKSLHPASAAEDLVKYFTSLSRYRSKLIYYFVIHFYPIYLPRMM